MWMIIKYFFITCFLCISTACYLLFATPQGLRYDINLLAKKIPGKLIVKNTEGNLLSGFTLHEFSYETPETKVYFHSLALQWNPLLLLQGKLEIHQLSLENGHIILAEKKSSQSSFTIPWSRIILHQLVVKKLYVQQSKSAIELNGNITDHWNLQWKLSNLDLKNWFPEYHGIIDSEGALIGSLTAPVLHANFHATNLLFYGQSIGVLNGQMDLTSHAASSLNLEAMHVKLNNDYYEKLTVTSKGHLILAKKQVTANFDLEWNHQALISGDFSYPNMQGKLYLHPMNLRILPSFIPYVKNLDGLLTCHINLQESSLNGTWTVTQGSFAIPTLGIHPKKISIQGYMDNKKITFAGELQSGEGKGHFAGDVNLQQKNFPLTLSLKGEKLFLVHLPEYKIVINPNIKLELSYPTLSLNGQIIVPYTEIRPKNFSGIVTLPDEVVFVDQSTVKHSNLETLLNIQLLLGEKIQINYSNLVASLAGNLHITKESDGPIMARGELHTLQGRYNAYGQKLAIEHGRLIYAGNTLANPGLDIRAVKTVKRIVTNTSNNYAKMNPEIPRYAGTESMTVGIQVNGTAEKPAISLFSVPSDLTQADILSYLILGQPQSNISGSEGLAILSLLSTMNPNSHKISHFTERLQKTLGLTELNFESVQNFNPNSQLIESNPSFVIGKQITKKLSMHYSIGLFDPISVLNLRYQFNRHWALQSETSTIDNGADLMYVFERD